MDNLTKHKLKLLAKGYGWNISYFKHTIYLQRGGDTISFDRANDLVIAEYPEGNGVVRLELGPKLIYDVFFDLMWYPDEVPRYQVKGDQEPLTYAQWVGRDGDDFAKRRLSDLLYDLEQGDIIQRDFGGNLVLGEYAHGLIVISHDCCWTPTNVITLDEAKAFHGLP